MVCALQVLPDVMLRSIDPLPQVVHVLLVFGGVAESILLRVAEDQVQRLRDLSAKKYLEGTKASSGANSCSEGKEALGQDLFPRQSCGGGHRPDHCACRYQPDG